MFLQETISGRKKVQKMREAKYMTYSVNHVDPERGVTFERRISVIVLGADHPVLLNLLGYKSQEEPIGKGLTTNSQVYFFSKEEKCTRYSEKLVRKSKEMNEEGKKML